MVEDRFTKYRALMDAEVNMIRTPEIRDLTRSILGGVLGKTWTMRTSRNHHPEDERGYCGNIIHTLRVNKIGKLILFLVEAEPWERDVFSSAALLHDSRKFGKNCEMGWTHPQHAQLAADSIKKATFSHKGEWSPDILKMVEILITAVEGHMSRFQEGPVYVPEIGTPLDIPLILVLADIIAAQDWNLVSLGVD